MSFQCCEFGFPGVQRLPLGSQVVGPTLKFRHLLFDDREQLMDAGLPALTQELESTKGTRTRVRVGPFETRAEADAAAEKIRALKLDAAVFKP